ncbi:Bestrophin, RFP-TM, chloride channel-domain-containing protein [Baffinella frigidus]|nr:Bestrophin, RFP-TM, chloride channel-domain-containing protein [Cryptophyta sp. CCMP2293]
MLNPHDTFCPACGKSGKMVEVPVPIVELSPEKLTPGEQDLRYETEIRPRILLRKEASLNLYRRKSFARRLVAPAYLPLATFSDVERRERDRRRLLKISSLSQVATYTTSGQEFILRMKGTMFRLIVREWITWLVIIIFVFFRGFGIYESSQGLQGHFVTVDISDVSALGVVLTFFLTFYSKEAYDRFKTQWRVGTIVEERILDIAMLVRAAFPDDVGDRFIRYMNAAHCMAFCGAGDCTQGTYTDENFFGHMNRVYKLLTDGELARIREIGVSGEGVHEIMAWCVQIVETQRKGGFLEEMSGAELKSFIMQFRSGIETIYAHHKQPIPYVYGNFVYTITLVYLPLFSYAVAVNSSPSELAPGETHTTGSVAFFFSIHFTIVFFNTFFVLGLQRLASQLQSPYGAHYEDMAVLTNIAHTITAARSIMAAMPPEADPEQEQEMRDAQPWLDQGFEHAGGAKRPLVPEPETAWDEENWNDKKDRYM